MDLDSALKASRSTPRKRKSVDCDGDGDDDDEAKRLIKNQKERERDAERKKDPAHRVHRNGQRRASRENVKKKKKKKKKKKEEEEEEEEEPSPIHVQISRAVVQVDSGATSSNVNEMATTVGSQVTSASDVDVSQGGQADEQAEDRTVDSPSPNDGAINLASRGSDLVSASNKSVSDVTHSREIGAINIPPRKSSNEAMQSSSKTTFSNVARPQPLKHATESLAEAPATPHGDTGEQATSSVNSLNSPVADKVDNGAKGPSSSNGKTGFKSNIEDSGSLAIKDTAVVAKRSESEPDNEGPSVGVASLPVRRAGRIQDQTEADLQDLLSRLGLTHFKDVLMSIRPRGLRDFANLQVTDLVDMGMTHDQACQFAEAILPSDVAKNMGEMTLAIKRIEDKLVELGADPDGTFGAKIHDDSISLGFVLKRDLKVLLHIRKKMTHTSEIVTFEMAHTTKPGFFSLVQRVSIELNNMITDMEHRRIARNHSPIPQQDSQMQHPESSDRNRRSSDFSNNISRQPGFQDDSPTRHFQSSESDRHRRTSDECSPQVQGFRSSEGDRGRGRRASDEYSRHQRPPTFRQHSPNDHHRRASDEYYPPVQHLRSSERDRDHRASDEYFRHQRPPTFRQHSPNDHHRRASDEYYPPVQHLRSSERDRDHRASDEYSRYQGLPASHQHSPARRFQSSESDPPRSLDERSRRENRLDSSTERLDNNEDYRQY